MEVKYFEDLEIWKLARELSKYSFFLTKNKDEFNKDYRFRDQIRASAGSVMDNIAEGFGRGGNKEFINFLFIAKGSNEETRSQFYRAFDFQYIDETEFKKGIEITHLISKKISNLTIYLKNSEIKGRKYKTLEEPDEDYLTN